MSHTSMPSDRTPVTPDTHRPVDKSLAIIGAVATNDTTISDAQRGLTHLAAVHGWTVAESAEVWRALGLDRRVT